MAGQVDARDERREGEGVGAGDAGSATGPEATTPADDSDAHVAALASFERRMDARLILSVVACGLMSFLGVVVETAMNVTFPALMGEFGVDTATVQWVTTGYLLVLTSIMPLSSLLKRRFRTKSLFLVALAAFAAGTVICALAPAFGLLVLGRLVQGVGTGIALPLMFNIVIEQAPFDRMGLMMGIATLITAMAPAVGPSVGGLLVETWGWRSVFVSLLPFLALSLVFGIWAIRQVTPTERVSFSPLQLVLLAGGFTSIVLAVNRMGSAGARNMGAWLLLVVGVALVACFWRASHASDRPLVRTQVFSNPAFALSVAYVVLLQAIVLGLGYLIPYYGQVVNGQDAFSAGCLLLPGCIVGAVMAPFGGRILDRLGARRPISTGAFLQLACIVCLLALAMGRQSWAFALIYVLLPISQGLSAANSMTNGLTYLPEGLRTDGNATFNTLQQLGGALGTALATAIVNSAQVGLAGDLVAGTVAGTREALVVLLALSVVALACALGALAKGERKVRG